MLCALLSHTSASDATTRPPMVPEHFFAPHRHCDHGVSGYLCSPKKSVSDGGVSEEEKRRVGVGLRQELE